MSGFGNFIGPTCGADFPILTLNSVQTMRYAAFLSNVMGRRLPLAAAGAGLVVALGACKTEKNLLVPPPAEVSFGVPRRVEMRGYTGNLMEPFLSRDGGRLFFNNLNSAPENTNLHWATKVNDSTFQYQGEIAGVNTPDLEGVPTLDAANTLYFVSTRSYVSTLSTIYRATLAGGTATNVQLVDGISRLEPGWVNFDVEVSADGQQLYFVDGKLNSTGIPQSADLVLAGKTPSGFARLPGSASLLQNINTSALEYAASIASDGLSLYFTRVQVPLTATSTPEILVATRLTPTEPFGQPKRIASITGFAEAPTIAPDGKRLYFHQKENNVFALFMVSRK